MSVKVLICDPVDAEGVMRLRREGFAVDYKSSIEPAKLEKAVAGYDALVVRSRTKVTKQILEKGRRLRVVGRVGAGVDNIDTKVAEKLGITVLNTPEAPSDSVAELTVGMMLALARRIPLADRLMKDGKWAKKELEGTLLNGKTLGLIGLGHIGAKVAKVAKAFGMKILVFKRSPPSRETLELLGAEFVSLGELLRRSDVVSIHVPLTEQTVGMIGEKELGTMKEGAVLVNTSRGGIVNEDALLKALKSGKLGGAGLDVYCTEPCGNLELVGLPNIVCTPHIGAQTREAQKAASVLLAEKLVRFFKEQKNNE